MPQNTIPFYSNPGGLVNGNSNELPLQPGEIRAGDVRMFPEINERGEVILRFYNHYTNEVEMKMWEFRYMIVQATMWVIISALVLTAIVILVIHFRPVPESESHSILLSSTSAL